MERRTAMKVTRRALLGMAIAASASAVTRDEREDSAVLLTNDVDPDLSLATLELRKLFLGFAVRHDGHLLRPVRNRSDQRLDEIFLQHVVAMSDDQYERRLLELSLQQGRPRPVVVDSHAELLRELDAGPHVVSFAWLSEVAGNPAIHVVRTLWRG